MKGRFSLRDLIEFGLLIPIATLFSIGAIYYHEAGLFDAYNIPIELIQIEPLSNIKLLFKYTSFIFFIFLINAHIPSLTKGPLLTTQRVALTLAVFMIYGFCAILFSLAAHGEIIFILVLVFAAFYVKEKFPGQISDNSGFMYIEGIIKRPILSLFVLALTYLLCYADGNMVVNSKYNYTTKGQKLLRKYSSYSIYGMLDSVSYSYWLENDNRYQSLESEKNEVRKSLRDKFVYHFSAITVTSESTGIQDTILIPQSGTVSYNYHSDWIFDQVNPFSK